jgi:hypothetical protein
VPVAGSSPPWAIGAMYCSIFRRVSMPPSPSIYCPKLSSTIELSTQVERYGIRDDIHNQIRVHVP